MASQRVTGLLVLLLLVMAAGPLPRPADAAGRHKPGPRKPAGGPIGKPGGLSPLFYKRTCPQFESIVLSNMRKWLATDVNIAAMLVRLIFHDVVVNGLDSSVMLNGTDSEKTVVPNRSLNGFFVIDDIKAQLEVACPGVVSCSDILVTTVRDAILLRSGPFYPLSWGRRDALAPNQALAGTNNPSPNNFVDFILTNVFGALNLGTADAVALSGAHTLGRGACGATRRRFTNFNNTGAPDPAIPASLLAQMVGNCSDPAFRMDLDRSTPALFDNKYFVNLVAGFGVFQSDQYLFLDPRTAPIVKKFALSQAAFFAQFKSSITKISNFGVLTGTQGEVRRNCALVNAPAPTAGAPPPVQSPSVPVPVPVAAPSA